MKDDHIESQKFSKGKTEISWEVIPLREAIKANEKLIK